MLPFVGIPGFHRRGCGRLGSVRQLVGPTVFDKRPGSIVNAGSRPPLGIKRLHLHCAALLRPMQFLRGCVGFRKPFVSSKRKWHIVRSLCATGPHAPARRPSNRYGRVLALRCIAVAYWRTGAYGNQTVWRLAGGPGTRADFYQCSPKKFAQAIVLWRRVLIRCASRLRFACRGFPTEMKHRMRELLHV